MEEDIREQKELVSKKVLKKAFEYLSELKAAHSKAKNIIHHKLRLQSYLGSSENNLTIQEKQFIFAARPRMINVKDNFKSSKAIWPAESVVRRKKLKNIF